MKFKILKGSHSQRNEEGAISTYRAGDVVESDLPLDKMFSNKFEPILRRRFQSISAPPLSQEEEKPIESSPQSTESPVVSANVELKALHRGAGRWDVVRVVDGVVEDEPINEIFLNRKQAKAMEEAGIEGLE